MDYKGRVFINSIFILLFFSTYYFLLHSLTFELSFTLGIIFLLTNFFLYTGEQLNFTYGSLTPQGFLYSSFVILLGYFPLYAVAPSNKSLIYGFFLPILFNFYRYIVIKILREQKRVLVYENEFRHNEILNIIKKDKDVEVFQSNSVDDLISYSKKNKITEIVYSEETSKSSALQLIELKYNGVIIETYNNFIEKNLEKIDLDSIDINWLLHSEGFSILYKNIQKKIKRLADIFLSIFLLIFLFPLLFITGIAIKLTSKGGVFFKQKRIGLYGKEFTLIKFRTMKIHKVEEFSKFSTENDPRITKIGRFLRKSRIDELPQLINILRGEMSFIGPRPEWDILGHDYEKNISYYPLRYSIKPGVTGWAQVMYPYGMGVDDAKKKLEYDLYYIKHQDIFLDLVIFFKTIKIIFFVKGK